MITDDYLVRVIDDVLSQPEFYPYKDAIKNDLLNDLKTSLSESGVKQNAETT